MRLKKHIEGQFKFNLENEKISGLESILYSTVEVLASLELNMNQNFIFHASKKELL